MDTIYGDVYINCPLSGEVLWQDWTNLARFNEHYVASFDKGLFFFVIS